MSEFPKPPAHIERFVAIIGPEATFDFLLTFGGAELYLPKSMKARGRLTRIIGATNSAALVAAADRLPRRIPTGKPWLAKVLKSKGLPVVEIARTLHASDVAVRGWLGKPDEPQVTDPRQPPLPFL